MTAGTYPSSAPGLVTRLNGTGHRAALAVFTLIVLAHWAEHIVQAIQIFALGWPRPQPVACWAWLSRGS